MDILTNFDRCKNRKTGLQYVNGSFVCSKCGYPLSLEIHRVSGDIIALECTQCQKYISVMSMEDACRLTEITIGLEQLYFKCFETERPNTSSQVIIDELNVIYKDYFENPNTESLDDINITENRDKKVSASGIEIVEENEVSERKYEEYDEEFLNLILECVRVYKFQHFIGDKEDEVEAKKELADTLFYWLRDNDNLSLRMRND